MEAENRSFDSSRPGTSMESSSQKRFHSKSLEEKSSFEERRGNPVGNYMFKVNNKDTRTTALAYFTPCSSFSIVNFEQVNADCIISP